MNQTNQVLRPAVSHIVARPPDLFLNLFSHAQNGDKNSTYFFTNCFEY